MGGHSSLPILSYQMTDPPGKLFMCAPLSKNVLLKRNAIGRAHSTVHRLNNGFDISLAEQLKAVGSNVTACKTMHMFLKSVQSRILYDKMRQRTLNYKRRRNHLRRQRHEEYKNRNVAVVKQISYAMGIMDNADMQHAQTDIKTCHSYAKCLTDVQNRVSNDHHY